MAIVSIKSIITFFVSLLVTTHSYCDFSLFQCDFDAGTVRIMTPGTYCIEENIVFDPKPGLDVMPNVPGAWFPESNVLFPGSEDQISGAFILGFFAAITIETNNVILDLQGYEIRFSFEFYLQQRWGAIIEIGNNAFLGATPFGDFTGDGFIAVKNIEIRNGILGLSSHHGIHSNDAKNIVIKDLVIKDFEVGAIQLNGFKGALIEDVKIGPSFQQVPVRGLVICCFIFVS